MKLYSRLQVSLIISICDANQVRNMPDSLHISQVIRGVDRRRERVKKLEVRFPSLLVCREAFEAINHANH